MIKPAIVIPVFNHAATVGRVIGDIRSCFAAECSPGAANDAFLRDIPIIIIDDGSTDDLAAALAVHPNLITLHHKKNRGKGRALRTGFTHAAALGCTHAITVDADGQHAPADVLHVLRIAREYPAELILGHRDMDHNGPVPIASKKGRDLSSFWLRIETGRHFPDSQCGLRAYPLEITRALPQRFSRYDFETEILARLAWAGIHIRNVPIACIYFSKPQRVTHFRPVVDTLRGIRVNLFLVFRRLTPIPFPRVANPRGDERVRFGRWWKWSAWRTAFREALRDGSSNSELAMAFALGIFVGLTPLYTLQTLLAIYFARRLHLNGLAAIIGSQISIPPLAPLWFALSFAVGHLLLDGQWILADINPWNAAQGHAWLASNILPFLLGNLLVAFVVAAAGLITARAVLFCVRRESQPIPCPP